MVPDPLTVLNQQIPDLHFSLVFWRSQKLFEDFEDAKDVLLTLTYKLTVRPGKGEFLWVSNRRKNYKKVSLCIILSVL